VIAMIDLGNFAVIDPAMKTPVWEGIDAMPTVCGRSELR